MPIVFYGLAIILLAISLRFKKDEGFLDKNSSNVIKGFFMLLIVFSHILNTFPYNGFLSTYLGYFRSILGQLIVSMFFFISGYGIVFSIQKTGAKYAKSIFTNRLLRIFLYGLVSLIPFFIYSACLGTEHPVGDYFLALIGLKSFGNAAWFFFAILVCYLISGIVFLFFYKHLLVSSILVTIGVLSYILIMYFLNQPSYTWDTIICFSFGMFVCVFKDKINTFLSKYKPLPFVMMIASVFIVGALQYLSVTRYGSYFPLIGRMWFTNFFFCLFFVCLTKVFTLKSHILAYLGNASFAIYMMHQIVLCCFADFGAIPNEWLNYLVLFVTTIVVGIPFYYLYKVIDQVITNPIVGWNRTVADE